MRIIVTGGRDYRDRSTIYRVLAEYDCQDPKPVLVHGACRTGTDDIASALARDLGWRLHPYPPRYDLYEDHLAPLMRNRVMARAGADLCIAFPGGDGTHHMIDQALKCGIAIHYIDRDGRSTQQDTLW